jgi:hypothetical protein
VEGVNPAWAAAVARRRAELVEPLLGPHTALTAADGDADNLLIGRNSVFYDRKGRDWDATITKVVDHPISSAAMTSTNACCLREGPVCGHQESRRARSRARRPHRYAGWIAT